MQSMWEALVGNRRFWVGYLSAGMVYTEETDLDGNMRPGCPSLLADDPGMADADNRDLVNRVSLGTFFVGEWPATWRLRIDAGFGEHTLYLKALQGFEFEWGRLDCHCYPDALREEELDLVARAVARQHGSLWAARLLLVQYVALTPENVDRVLAVMHEDLTSSGHFTSIEIAYMLDATRRSVRADFRWVPHPELGWVADGQDGMSLRQEDAAQFVAVKEFLAYLKSCDELA